jgi:hypothetical protein
VIGGGGGHTHFGVYDPNSLSHSQLYIYKELRSKRIVFPSFKTLDLVADQSLAANSTYASKYQKSKIIKSQIVLDHAYKA